MKNRKVYLTISLIIALALIVAGINRKEFETYFERAKMICMQCIGIG